MCNDAFEKDAEVCKDDTLRGMISIAYSKKMRSLMVLAWIYILAFMALTVWTIVVFSKTDDVKTMILCATGFIMSIMCISIIKLWIWQNIAKISLKREIKRLELKIDSL